MDESEPNGVVLLLHYEISVHANKCRPKLLEILKLGLDRVLQLTNYGAVQSPPWPLSIHRLKASV